MKSAVEELEKKVRTAKAASRRMAYLSAGVKNEALHNVSNDLLARKDAPGGYCSGCAGSGCPS